MFYPDYAMITVKDFGAGVYLFGWRGAIDAPVEVSDEIAHSLVFRLTPWKLEKVPMAAQPFATLYRGATLYRRIQ